MMATAWTLVAVTTLAVMLVGLVLIWTVKRVLKGTLAKLVVTSQSVDVALASMVDRLDTQGERIDSVERRVRVLEDRPTVKSA